MWQNWSGRAALSLLDQAIASGGNFLVSILLARWLMPAEYGAFSVAFEAFLFATLFHNGLILEPMKVVGPRRFAGRLGEYLRAQLVLHTLVGGVGAIASIGVGLWLLSIHNPAGPALVGFGVALPFILVFWLARHIAYVEGRPSLALRASAIYSAVLLSGLLLVWNKGLLSAPRAGLLMGLAGLSAGAASWGWHRHRERRQKGSNLRVPGVLRENWEYGKWVLAAGLLGWMSNAAYTPLVAVRSGLEGAASLRAIQNLTMPMGQLLTVLAILLLPAVSLKAVTGGSAYLRRTALKMSAVLGGLAICYVVVVLLASPWIMDVFYGNEKYHSVSWLLPVYGFVLCIKSVADCSVGVALRAAGRSDLVFHAAAGAAASSLLIGVPLVALYGVEGAAAGLLLSSSTFCVVVVYVFHKLTAS